MCKHANGCVFYIAVGVISVIGSDNKASFTNILFLMVILLKFSEKGFTGLLKNSLPSNICCALEPTKRKNSINYQINNRFIKLKQVSLWKERGVIIVRKHCSNHLKPLDGDI